MLYNLKNNIMTALFFDDSYFSNLNIDDVLDMRDDEVFDNKWIQNYELVKNYKIDDDTSQLIDMIREIVFKKIYDITKSSDLAACVSDDFDLMCKAYVLNINSDWLANLANTYVQKKIPFGNLDNTKLNFMDEFKMLANT